jgi:hypothetical protein
MALRVGGESFIGTQARNAMAYNVKTPVFRAPFGRPRCITILKLNSRHNPGEIGNQGRVTRRVMVAFRLGRLFIGLSGSVAKIPGAVGCWSAGPHWLKIARLHNAGDYPMLGSWSPWRITTADLPEVGSIGN